jgi:hypothetical protein
MFRIGLWQLLRPDSGDDVSRDGKEQPVEGVIVIERDDGKPGSFSYENWLVKPDPARWTETVKVDLRENIKALKDLSPMNVYAVYEDALAAFHEGFNLRLFCQALVAHGMTKKRAREVAFNISSKTNALMWSERLMRAGIKSAYWSYSGAPCGDAEQDAAHKSANRMPFLIEEGMLINGKRTWPGREDGCKCTARAIIPGLS